MTASDICAYKLYLWKNQNRRIKDRSLLEWEQSLALATKAKKWQDITNESDRISLILFNGLHDDVVCD